MQQREILVMGIINVNRESFYEGSRCSPDEFSKRMETMLNQGADIIDIGACSTRPGSTPVTEEQEWANLSQVIEEAKRLVASSGMAERVYLGGISLPRISIDTFRSGIVRQCYEKIGPFIVNDISSGEEDPRMLSTVAELHLPYIAMHKRGTPDKMQSLCDYPTGVTSELSRYFQEFYKRALQAGMKDIIIDPGFGFAKSVEQNYTLVRELKTLKEAVRDLTPEGRTPLLLAALSRKSMLWRPLGITPDQALPATVALHLQCLLNGADMIRVHDVPEGIQCRTLYHLLTS